MKLTEEPLTIGRSKQQMGFIGLKVGDLPEQRKEYERLNREHLLKQQRADSMQKRRQDLAPRSAHKVSTAERPKLQARKDLGEVQGEVFKGPVWVGAGDNRRCFPEEGNNSPTTKPRRDDNESIRVGCLVRLHVCPTSSF